ncbi:endochitinase [Lentzea sp. NBRC 105346]|nr:endochitinase [Lentzea sp. NBRC 105346]
MLGSAGVLAIPGVASAADKRGSVFTNNIGYEASGPKRAVIADGGPAFTLVDVATGGVVFRGVAKKSAPVPDWQANHFPAIPASFSVADFSAFTKPGEYVIVVGGVASRPFVIEPQVLERRALPHVVRFFRDSRSFGEYDRVDRNLPYEGDPAIRVDAHGGWYDAAADWSKHFTQLSKYSFCNTLQLPLTAWVLWAAYDELTRRNDPNFVHLRDLLLDEALYGAEYLARVKMPNGSFYGSVRQPQEDDISIDPKKRFLRKGPLNFREGCGVAIAALARAGSVQPAAEAFEFLQANNVRLTNDGKENIQDDYNALLAAVELFKATKKDGYKAAADARAASLMARLTSWGAYRDYWRADDKDRPYFHPSDAGMPVVSLLHYASIAADSAKVLAVVRRSLEFELSITSEVANPFGYGRQLVQTASGQRFSGFFFPHDAAGSWWQGENARLASMATAARMAASRFDAAFGAKLKAYAADQLNWIVGLNPFDVCMLEGHGRTAPTYLEYPDGSSVGSWRWIRAAGGIVNGITGRAADGRGIEWDPGVASSGPNTDWRWLEQWIPHSTWFLYAAAIG